MANTYVLISSNTLGASATSVTFSSIPSTYTDLVLRISARSDDTGVFQTIQIRFNNDSGTTYSRVNLYGNGSTAASALNANLTATRSDYGATASGATASTFGNAEIYIPNYLSTTTIPVGAFGAGETNATAAYIATTAGQWRGSAAINRIDISPNFSTVNFVSGSSFYLYGIKSS